MFNTELFVFEVQKRPCLWKVKDSSHSDRHLKLRAWEQIAKVLNASNDSYSLSTKNITTDELQRKWKHLRDYYTREKKRTSKADDCTGGNGAGRGSSVVHKRKSPLLDKLQFLDANRESDTVEVTIERNIEDENFYSNTNEEEDTSVPEYDFAISRPNKIQRIEVQQSHLNAVAEDNEDSADKQFLASLLPIIKKMSVKERFRFRAELLTPTPPRERPVSCIDEEEKARNTETRKRYREIRKSQSPPPERPASYIDDEEKTKTAEIRKRHKVLRKSQSSPEEYPDSWIDEEEKNRTLETRKRHRVIRKSEEIEIVNKEIKSADGTLKRDEFTIYGEYVANKLRNIRNTHARHTAEFHINGILYKAEMGEYDGVSRDSTVSLRSASSRESSNVRSLSSVMLDGDELNNIITTVIKTEVLE